MAEKLITDIGGDEAGEIPREPYDMLFWEKQMIATFNMLREKGLMVTDEYRRIVEEMSPDYYKNSTFYGRRIDGIVALVIEKGIIDEEALKQRTKEILEAGTRDHV